MTGLLPMLLPISVICYCNVSIHHGQMFQKQILPSGVCNRSHLTIRSQRALNAECTAQFEKEDGKGGRRLEISGPRVLLVAVD